ncbi:ArsR/SmtB family transcription factor [Methylocystis parvus]|uniref:ArsR/SmtB family transcription factor n=1 Tax=Methylocystis parvus TaxID=134 RepID=UPI003C71C084
MRSLPPEVGPQILMTAGRSRRGPAPIKLADASLQALIPKAEEAEQFLKALANAHRLMILCELLEGEACVTQLQKAVGLSQSSLSQHLARLRQDALVKTRRESRTIYYSLADDRVKRMIALLHDIFCAVRVD